MRQRITTTTRVFHKAEGRCTICGKSRAVCRKAQELALDQAAHPGGCANP